MDKETLFTSSKWDILKALSKGKKSPLELARETKTSIANISQQLRMLELANIVKSERVSNRERGEPRLLYTLSGPLSYLITTSPDFVDKKQLVLSLYHEVILRIWFIRDESAHYYLEKFFWEIEQKIERIDMMLVKADHARITVIILSKDMALKKELKSREIRKSKTEGRRVEIFVLTKDEFLNELVKGARFSLKEEFNVIYDPNQLFEKIRRESEVKA